MEIKVAKKALESALSVVSPALGSGNAEIQSHYLFRCTSDKLEVLTYSGRVAASSPVADAEITAPGVFTVEGWRLKQWLKAIGDSPVTFKAGKPGTVKVTANKGQQQFPSVDPSAYPYWDEELKTATVRASVKAKGLKDTFDALRGFTATDEVNRPDLCVVQFKDGTFRATDHKAVCFGYLSGIEKSDLRVHTKDLGAIIAFLSTCGDKDVEILEHEKALFIRRADGAVFSETKFLVNFPEFPGDTTEDQFLWTLSRPEVQDAILFLKAGASKDETKLRFARPVMVGSTAFMQLSMNSIGGGESVLSVPIQNEVIKEGAPTFPESGCGVSLAHFENILGLSKDPVVELGLNVKGRRGYLRVVVSGDPKIVTILGWDQI
jgi:DNA polymerase III sliding clamp (beta) subunit (PCNA family)